MGTWEKAIEEVDHNATAPTQQGGGAVEVSLLAG